MCSALFFLSQIDPEGTVVGSEVWDGGGGYGALMMLLILLVGILAAVFVYTKKIGIPRAPKSGSLELLETKPLGGRQFLVVAKYGEKRVLLGVCPGRIDFLCDMTDGLPASESDFQEALEQKISEETQS